MFLWQLAKFVQPIQIFLAYLVPVDVDVVPNKLHQLISEPQNYVFTCQANFWKVSSNFFAVSMATVAILKIPIVVCTSTQTMDINSQHHNLLGNQISPKSKDFCILASFLVQNHRSHHSKARWSPYGAACLTPCKYPFPLKSVHF